MKKVSNKTKFRLSISVREIPDKEYESPYIDMEGISYEKTYEVSNIKDIWNPIVSVVDTLNDKEEKDEL